MKMTIYVIQCLSQCFALQARLHTQCQWAPRTVGQKMHSVEMIKIGFLITTESYHMRTYASVTLAQPEQTQRVAAVWHGNFVFCIVNSYISSIFLEEIPLELPYHGSFEFTDTMDGVAFAVHASVWVSSSAGNNFLYRRQRPSIKGFLVLFGQME